MSADPSNHSFYYRPDIDGLRAVAVLAVVIFHAFPQWAPGGFAGVDVFFVISGFLITTIIERAIHRGEFTFKDFYARRIRRIFPALSVVLIFCLGYGWLDLLSSELEHLGRHVAGGAAFIANWILHKESIQHGGYFDKAAHLKPLLHLWSLGIEEQFYILWPPLVILAVRWRWSVARVALAVGAISLALNLSLLPHFKEATFYLPFTRLWELLVGCALASSVRFQTITPQTKDWLRHAYGWLGLLLILLSVVFLTPTQPFPGWRALGPVAGAALMILAGSESWPNRYLLSHPWAVGIGLISYPLYLWHWPLLYFGRLDTQFGTPVRFSLVALAFLFSWLTYLFLEKRVRFARSRAVIPCLVFIMLIVGVTGKVLAKTKAKGWLYRNGSTEQDLSTIIQEENIEAATSEGCLSPSARSQALWCRSDNRPPITAVVLGDSHAHALYPGLVATAKGNQRWAMIANPGCGAYSGLIQKSEDRNNGICEQLMATVPGELANHPEIKLILIAVASRVLNTAAQGSGADAVVEGLWRTISIFKKQGKEVVFLIDNPTLQDPNTCVQRFWPRIKDERANKCDLPVEQVLEKEERYRKIIARLQARVGQDKELSGVTFFDPLNLFCNTKTCSPFKDGKFLLIDHEHLSDSGGELVASALQDTLTPTR